MGRLSILHAAKFYPPIPGGMESVIADLCAGTSAEWDVRVVSANNGRETVHEWTEGVNVVRTATYAVRHSVPLCPEYPLQLWRQSADCVVLHEPNPISGSSIFLHTPAKRLIIWHHSDLVRPWWAIPTYGRLQRALYRRAYQVIVDDAPAVWLYEPRNLAAAHARLRLSGVRADAWWAGMGEWSIPANERIPRDRAKPVAAR